MKTLKNQISWANFYFLNQKVITILSSPLQREKWKHYFLCEMNMGHTDFIIDNVGFEVVGEMASYEIELFVARLTTQPIRRKSLTEMCDGLVGLRYVVEQQSEAQLKESNVTCSFMIHA